MDTQFSIGGVVPQQIHVQPSLLIVVQCHFKVIVFLNLTLDRVRLTFTFRVATPLPLMLATTESERDPLASGGGVHRARFNRAIRRIGRRIFGAFLVGSTSTFLSGSAFVRPRLADQTYTGAGSLELFGRS